MRSSSCHLVPRETFKKLIIVGISRRVYNKSVVVGISDSILPDYINIGRVPRCFLLMGNDSKCPHYDVRNKIYRSLVFDF